MCGGNHILALTLMGKQKGFWQNMASLKAFRWTLLSLALGIVLLFHPDQGAQLGGLLQLCGYQQVWEKLLKISSLPRSGILNRVL